MTFTKGNVIVEEIKIGDIHYEFEYGRGVESEVLTLPVRSDEDEEGNGYWTWESRNIRTGKIIKYGVRENMSHYGPNLYDYIAYATSKWV